MSDTRIPQYTQCCVPWCSSAIPIVTTKSLSSSSSWVTSEWSAILPTLCLTIYIVFSYNFHGLVILFLSHKGHVIRNSYEMGMKQCRFTTWYCTNHSNHSIPYSFYTIHTHTVFLLIVFIPLNREMTFAMGNVIIVIQAYILPERPHFLHGSRYPTGTNRGDTYCG